MLPRMRWREETLSMDEHTTVVPAVPEDAERLADVLGRAFQDDPVSTWLIPDDQERIERQRDFLKVFLDDAMASGQVHTTPDRTAVALWVNVQPDEPQDDNIDELLGKALGPHYERFVHLGDQMDATHPHDRLHGYLQFVAVDPPWQEHGIGAALIRHRLAQLDAMDMPAFLDASNLRTVTLYERLGFRQLPSQIRLPDGTLMLPMWREPRANGHQAT
jgi:ribosomal protein S18 acetylase RimI-like enzyme